MTGEGRVNSLALSGVDPLHKPARVWSGFQNLLFERKSAMGERGPIPKPSSQRSRRGRNTLADRLGREGLGAARPPLWLGEVAREFWDSYAPYLRKRGCLTKLDEAAFITFCVTWQRITEMREMMAREGEILTSPRGRKYQH